ncbi:hypothetical protein A4G20_06255 [Pasteurellaceae bacterium RH1A]|nr:hypothetical protein A4G20_06255 [Pasteurellaceae bacterium RH1A]
MDDVLNYYEDLRLKTIDSNHWCYCEKNRLPYISINNYNHKYDNVFYDITNLSCDLNEISENVRRLYFSYLDFFLIPLLDVECLLDDNYFFNLYVKKEHTEYFAKQLFIYLVNQ